MKTHTDVIETIILFMNTSLEPLETITVLVNTFKNIIISNLISVGSNNTINKVST